MTKGDNSTKALADALNHLLADSFALYMKSKHFHWHVSGPHFRDYHLLFDEQAAQILATTDLIAERVRKIGHQTLTSIADIGRHQSIADNDNKDISAGAMLQELQDDNQALLAKLKETKELAEEAGDNATDGLLDDWTNQTEERIWFLRQSSAAA